MGSLNQRGDINAAAIAVYVIVTAGLGLLMIRNGIRGQLGYLYILLFTLVKIVGAAMAIDVQLTSNASLYTPAAILSTVVLSPLMLGVCSLINPGKDFIRNLRSPVARHIPRLLRLTHIVIIASLALGIVGGLDAFSTNPTANDYKNGRLYLRIAAGLSCAAWALIMLSVVIFIGHRHSINPFYRKLLPIVGGLVMPILAARLVYTVGIAVTIDTTKTQVFNPLTGSWLLYLLLAFLPEVGVSSVLVVAGLIFGSRKYDRVESMSEDQMLSTM